jgi:hypothetical protein
MKLMVTAAAKPMNQQRLGVVVVMSVAFLIAAMGAHGCGTL